MELDYVCPTCRRILTLEVMLDGKEVYRSSGFIDIMELERKIVQLEEVCEL